jgi:hypothetical protein
VPSPGPGPVPAGPVGQGGQGSETQASVGWQASQPGGYFPAAGPLASSAGPEEDEFAWGSSRKTLMNVLLFGVAPVVLAGVIAAAYLLSTSHKGHTAASAGFHAQAAASAGTQVQNAIAPTPGTSPSSASPAPKPSHHHALTFPTLSAAPGQADPPGTGISTHAPSPEKDPAPRHSHSSAPAPRKPAPAPSAVPVPADLGAPNFDGYCSSNHEGTALNVTGNAVGWRCSSDQGTALSNQAVCAYTYRVSNAELIDVTTQYTMAFAAAIECWSTHGELGALDLSAYCSAEGWGSAVYGSNVTELSCSKKPDVDATMACQVEYKDDSAFARYEFYAVANSWECWG